MEENTPVGQETVPNQPPIETISTLENELEAIKAKAAIQASVPQATINYEKKNSNLLKYGFLLLIISILVAGVYLGRNFLNKNTNQVTTISSPFPTALPSPTVNPFEGWKNYSEPLGIYSFNYPEDYSIAEYKEDGHLGVKITDGEVEIKALLLKGLKTSAVEKITNLRLTASQIPGQKEKVGQVENIKVGERSGYKYMITSIGEIIADDILLDVGDEILRIEIKYKGEEIVDKILSSFKFATILPSPSLLPKTGLFSTGEPASEGSLPATSQPIP